MEKKEEQEEILMIRIREDVTEEFNDVMDFAVYKVLPVVLVIVGLIIAGIISILS